jgi:Rieske Fe-S protein
VLGKTQQVCKSNEMKRRDFLKNSTTVLSAAALAQLLTQCDYHDVKPTGRFIIDATDPRYSNLQTIGGVVLVNDIFIIRSGQSSYVALSRVCTHRGCNIGYNPGAKDFECPCHGGVYDLAGNVVSGPPPAPLEKYQVFVNGSTLTVA